MVLIILLSLTSTVILILAYKNKRLRNKYDRLLNENQEDSNVLFFKSRYASMGETVGNIAHQWKQPLNAIGAIQNLIKAKLIYQGEISKEDLLESVETSVQLIQHLADTIDTFYSFLSQRNHKTMSFSVKEELEAVHKITEYSFVNSHIALNFVFDADPTIQGNPNEFTHAILNLILNAKDAFDTASTNTPIITVYVSDGSEICTITISDNAVGIRLKPIEMVFDLHITTKESGSGLGLFMTKNIIEKRFGGTIGVENKNGGACFTITLPYARYGEHLSQVTASEEKLSLERINQLTRQIIELEELEAQKENERIRLFFERQLVGMAITSPTKGWIHTNKKLQDMLGYTHDELSQLTWADVTHPDDLAPDVADFERMLSGEIDSYIVEKRYIRKDGGIIYTYLSIGCVRKEEGSVDYVLALIEDITERKEAQALLEQREKEYRSLVENLPGCAYTFKRSADGHFSFPYASSGIQEIYGLQPQDIVEDMAPLHALAHPDDRPRIEEEIEKSVSEARDTHLVFRVLNPVLGERWIDARTKVELLEDGTMLWHGIMLDITEHIDQYDKPKKLK